MNKREAREMGWIEGYGIVEINWSDLVDQSEYMSKQEFIDHVISEAAETEVNARQYSPFEFTAHEFNHSRNPDGMWEAYESGVVAGAKRAARDLSKSRGWKNEGWHSFPRRAREPAPKTRETFGEFTKRVTQLTGLRPADIPVRPLSEMIGGQIVARRGGAFVWAVGYPDKYENGVPIWDAKPENFATNEGLWEMTASKTSHFKCMGEPAPRSAWWWVGLGGQSGIWIKASSAKGAIKSLGNLAYSDSGKYLVTTCVLGGPDAQASLNFNPNLGYSGYGTWE